ncbi:MAG TPA: HAMP domain-containing protein [bacterium]
MRIRKKLLFGLGFYVLFSLALGLFAYRELHAITAGLRVIEAADDLTNTMLEVRRYEKNYLLFRDEASSRELGRYLAELRDGIGRLERESGGEGRSADFARMRDATAAYERLFTGLPAPRAGAPAGDGEGLESLRAAARELQALVEGLAGRERSALDALLAGVQRSLRLLPLAIAAAILVGVVVDAQLSRSIARPVGDLEALTRQIAAGDFSRRIAIRGEDEFSSLARSFNQMQDRLHDTLTSLELANQELRANRAQLLDAERFAMLGRFAAGVAHEINNPLAVINEKAGLMRDYLARSAAFPERERFVELLGAVADGVERCRVVTHRILEYAGGVAVSPEAADVNAVIGEALKLSEPRMLARHVRLSLELAEGLPPISAGRRRLRQVLLDVIANRVEAAATGGQVHVSSALKDAGTVRIAVSGSGAALTPAVLEHLFEPFSTAPETGRDPGLGLWVSRGILRKLGGDILVATGAEGETTFLVEVPVGTPAQEPPGGTAV